MSKIAKSLTDLIGNTPLLELCNYNKSNALDANDYGKTRVLQSIGERQRQSRLCHGQRCRGKGSFKRRIYNY